MGIEIIRAGKYRVTEECHYFSPRYAKTVTILEGFLSDGATGAVDIVSNAWIVHDWLCGNWMGEGPEPPPGQWDDGSDVTNWQASTVLGDILISEGRPFRAVYWWWATWLLGGGEARKNGMLPPEWAAADKYVTPVTDRIVTVRERFKR